MLFKRLHISDEDLIRSADRELPARQTSRIHGHLEICPDCRARMNTFLDCSDALRHSWLQENHTRIPPIGPARARLRLSLASRKSAAPGTLRDVSARLCSAGAALALLACITAVLVLVPHLRENRAPTAALDDVPNRLLTPGATRKATAADVCAAARDEVIAPVSAAVRAQVLAEYGIHGLHRRDYEVDYLITPGLGGTDDVHNLWPEPYGATEWNAHVKDSLEEHLHEMVCAHQINLQTAQNALAGDWIEAYKTYFHTDRPLYNVAFLTEKLVALR